LVVRGYGSGAGGRLHRSGGWLGLPGQGQGVEATPLERQLLRGVRGGGFAPVDLGMTARALLGALQEAALAVVADASPSAACKQAHTSITRLIEGLARGW